MAQVKQAQSTYDRNLNHAIQLVQGGHPGRLADLIAENHTKLRQVSLSPCRTKRQKQKQRALAHDIRDRLHALHTVDYNYSHRIEPLRTPQPRKLFKI